MILVAGIPHERPVALVIDALDELGAAYCVFDQRHAANARMQLELADEPAGGALSGTLTVDGQTVALADLSGMYLRLMDDRLLPAVAHLPAEAPPRQHSRRLHELLVQFADLMHGRVLNRPADTASNHSKPYQAQVIRQCGFDIPETLITNDPTAAREFVEGIWAEDSSVIYKSVSGVRSIVRRVEPPDLLRLDRVRWCPTQFQRQVTGFDVRVHVIGDRVLAARIDSDATDYRYAARETGTDATITACELAPDTAERCVNLAQRLRLPLAGIDLRRTPEGRDVCFEVNPSPAFSYYESRAGLPIAAAVARYLGAWG